MKTKLFLLLLLAGVYGHAQSFQAGAAQSPINPEIPAFVAGHSKNRKFTGVHDSLFVKALVVNDQRTNLTLLTFDCIGLLYPQLEEIREQVKKRIKGIDQTHIVMSSTHTHTGPDVVGLWGPDLLHSGVDANYMRKLVETAVATIESAWNSRKNVHIDYALGSHGEGWVYNISEPNELDRSLTVIRFADQSGRSVATLTNFACHPTILDGEHLQVSADYPAGFYRRMDAQQGGINLFLQGAIGGWVQPEGEPKTFDQAYRRGYELADAVLKLLRNPIALKERDIRFSSNQYPMPVTNQGFIQLAKAGVIKREIDTSVLTEIAAFRIGEAMFATHPGETVPAMSLATKRLMRTTGPKMVMGLSMDALGYIIKRDFFDPKNKIPHSEYLCSMSAGPATAELVMKKLEGLIDSVNSKE